MPEEEGAAWPMEKSSGGGGTTNGSTAGHQLGSSTEPLETAADNDDDDEGTSREQLCGLGSWRPSCLQRLANHRVYVFAYVVIGVVQGMIMAYFSGVLTTLEKVFGIQSSTMGLVLSGNDISQILGGLVINHIGNRGSRPFWLSVGMLTTGASCFLYASCHLLWNSQYYDLGGHQDVHRSSTSDVGGGGGDKFDGDFCQPDRRSVTSVAEAEAAARTHDARTMDAMVTQSDTAVLALLFVGQLISGIGSTALFSLGFTYMDDSVTKRNSALYTGLTSSLRCLGPVFGFFLASFCLSFNVKLSERSRYAHNDPLFIGCWWLGFLLLGILQVLITFPMILFPKKLPPSSSSSSRARQQSPTAKDVESKVAPLEQDEKKSAWKDFWESMGRLGRNPVVVSYMILVGPAVLGMIGSAIFMPKYLEAQFGQTPGKASIFSGISGMLMLMLGTLTGGIVMWKFQPRALYVTGFTCFVDALHIGATFFMMILDCGKEDFVGLDLFVDGGFDVTSECSRGCSCGMEFNPMCVGTANFLSPCLAGCTEVDNINSKIFLNCLCAARPAGRTIVESIDSLMLNESSAGAALVASWSTGRRGYCPGGRSECPYLWPYALIKGGSTLVGSTTRIGFILVLIRSVEKRDKSLVLALLMVVSSLTGFIPGPIVFGAAVDKTCLFWDVKADGQRGNCWVYDAQAFSYWFHGLKILCYSITTIMSFFICYYGRNVNLYDEENLDAEFNAQSASTGSGTVVLKEIKKEAAQDKPPRY